MMSSSRALHSTFALRSLRRLSSTSAGSVVDEMVAYARSHYKDNCEQALDVLKSGLGFQQVGVGAGRLYLAQADIEADRGHWPEVSQLCRKAATVASELTPDGASEALAMAEVELAASLMGTRAFLTQNKDAEAFEMAQQSMEIARKSFAATGAEDKRWQSLVLSNSNAALVQHAAGELESAAESFDAVMTLIDHTDERARPPTHIDDNVSQALSQTAAFRTAQQKESEASQLAARAAVGAERALDASKNSLNPLEPPGAMGEALVDARLQQAQASIGSKEWEAAEKHLGSALEAAEAVGAGNNPSSTSNSHVRIAFILLPLAGVYARTGRVTLAEGLYREVSNLLRMSPTAAEAVALQEVHPSVGALAAWRYAQLLTALPRRATEAAGWQKLATELYDDAPLRMVLEPMSVFGSLDYLQGKGAPGYGVVLDLMTRRALPRSALPPL